MSTCQNMGDYLFVEVSEPYSLNQIMTTIREVADYCQKEDLNKVLVETRRMAGNPNILDRYRIGIEIVKIWGPRIKIAIIARSDLVNHMTENTAVNRGAKLIVTADIEHALQWLEIEDHKEIPGAKFHD